MRNHEVVFCITRAQAGLARFLHDLARKLGEPSAYYDGVPAGHLVDDVINELERLGVPKSDPRDPTWPLQPHERIRQFLVYPARWQVEVFEGRPAPAPAPGPE